jgi:hypothetical protein
MAAARPLVTVQGLDGSPAEQTALPAVFLAPIRPDVVGLVRFFFGGDAGSETDKGGCQLRPAPAGPGRPAHRPRSRLGLLGRPLMVLGGWLGGVECPRRVVAA